MRLIISVVVVLLVTGLLGADMRHASVARAFRALTGYPLGRPGMIVDHKIPLCAGGPDTIDNLQWQKVAESYNKDTFERALCREMERQGYYLVKVTPLK
jgi:hypothetical protein